MGSKIEDSRRADSFWADTRDQDWEKCQPSKRLGADVNRDARGRTRFAPDLVGKHPGDLGPSGSLAKFGMRSHCFRCSVDLGLSSGCTYGVGNLPDLPTQALTEDGGAESPYTPGRGR